MKYKSYITIAIILLSAVRLTAQENYKLCPYDIKELLVQFDKYSNFESDVNQKNISSLFYYDENNFGSQKIIPNIFIDWFGDEGSEMLTLGDFAMKYKSYFTNKEIKYDTLLNDRIARDYNLIGYKISVVKVTKEVKYIDRSKGGRAWQIKPVKKDADLYFSIISVKTKNKTTVNKIVRITTIVPNYDWYTPQQVGVSFTPAETWINSSSLNTTADFGFRFKASANYTLTGKNYFNLFLSPGLGFSRYNFTVENPVLDDSITNAIDIDQYPYIRHIHGKNLEQQIRVDYFDIPIDFNFQWYIKSFRIRATAGVTVGLRTSSAIRNDFGSVEYYGEYNFGTEEDPWIVNLTDLPDKYGFSTYQVKSLDDFSYLSPVNISGNLGAMFGYSPDKRLDFNIGVYSNFGLNKLNKSTLPAHLTEKNGELYPLVYADSKTRLNSAGLYFSVNYNIQEPNVPYSRKIDRELVSRMKSVQRENIFVTEKKPTTKLKVPLYINSKVATRIHKVKCQFNGLNEKDNFAKSLKLKQKPNYLKLNMPDNEQMVNNVELLIQKPFSYNITREKEDVKSNQLDDEFILTGSELLNSKNEDIKLVVTPIKDYYIFYIDQYQVMEDPHTGEIQRNIYNRVREDISNAVMRDGEGLLYFSLSAPIYYHSFDSTDIFLQKASQSRYELSGNRLEDFKKALDDNNVNLSRRRLFINIYLTSYNTYEEFIKKFLLNDLLKMDQTEKNWANIEIRVYLPLNLTASEKEKVLFTGDQLPVMISNWRLINIY